MASNDGMPKIDNMCRVEDFLNSGISVDYVPNWGLKEGIRELIQNAVDGMTEFVMKHGGSKKDLKVEIKEGIYDGKKYRAFEWRWPEKEDIIVGNFTYNPAKQELVLKNPGTLKRYNLLLGGSGENKKKNKLRDNTCQN